MNPTGMKCLFAFAILLYGNIVNTGIKAQPYNCNFKPPVIRFDFGDDNSPKDLALTTIQQNYRRNNGNCPDDGEYAFASYTSDCFYGNWINLYNDHTPGSSHGRMMLVNAAYTPGAFFAMTFTGLKENTTYELGAWFVNICRRGEGCTPIPPVINMTVYCNNRWLTRFRTGEIAPTGTASWQRHAGIFTLPAGANNITVYMENIRNGGCGNDFAMDDIEISECITPEIKEKMPAPKAIATIPAQKKITLKKEEKKTAPPPLAGAPAYKKNEIAFEKEHTVTKPETNTPGIVKKQLTTLPVPEVLKSRTNVVAKKIETPETDISIALYDNGEIDGDTVSIYHNNLLVQSHVGLSEKPVTLTLKVDEEHPYHELTMVAENLGSIPPNTSVMIITTAQQRYEVFISSSEQKNAKVIFELKKRP
jgi:hypothetical protein